MEHMSRSPVQPATDEQKNNRLARILGGVIVGELEHRRAGTSTEEQYLYLCRWAWNAAEWAGVGVRLALREYLDENHTCLESITEFGDDDGFSAGGTYCAACGEMYP